MDEQEGNADAPASPSNAIETAENLNGVTDENVDDVDASTLTVAVDAAVALSVESPSPHEISPAVTADFSDVNLCDSPIREFSPPQENSSSDLAVGTATLSLNSDSESERKDVIIKKQGPDPPKVYSTPYVEQEDKRPPIEIFMELKTKIEKGDVSNKDIVGKVLKIMVGGTFDLETKFVVQDANNIKHMLDLLEICQPNLQAELWSVFIAVVRKSTRNLQACTEVGLICELLQRLPAASDVVADLFIELLGVLASYSADVKEIKCFLSALRAADDEGKHERRWPRHSAKLLHVLKQLPKKDGPDVFFSFSGNKGAGIALPPLKSWSIQNGWTFNTWFRMDPLNSVNFEREKPFLFCFRTSKGVGYSAHFVGNCLVVTSAKTRTRGYQHCVKYEFSPRKWYMVSLVWVHNRWSKSEIRSYVNGQQIDTIEMSWFINTNEFDKCVIGSSFDTGNEPESSFCGQMGAVYAFADTLNMQQINSVYCLGPSYQSQFKYENETSLPDGYKKYLFDGKLSSSIMFSYCPKNCDRQLCLECSPKTNHSYFVHTPHALMQQDVTVVKTHSIHSTLHSVGGVQMLLPLFNQLDYPHDAQGGKQAAVDYSICSMLLSVICTLLEQSPSNQQQMFQNKGFLVISNALQSSCKRHLTENVLESFLSAAKFLLSSTTTGIPLLKHLFDYVLFNPALWVHTPAKIQLRLYQYLATDFLSNSQFYGNIRRVSTVLQMLHALKYYYWIVNPEAKSGYAPKATDGPRPSNMDVARIRSFMLQFVRKMMMRADGIKDDELQAVLNYLTTVHEDDNLYDVLQTAIALMADDPASMVPGFDRKRGICTVFKLVASANELIRIPGLKLLGYFLCRSTSKRKQDVMGPHNLFTLLTERLLLHTASLSMPTYNVLFEILTENMTPGTCYEAHATPDINARFENPMIIKVIANLITQSQPTRELLQVKQLFLTDLITLCGASRDNRRTVLQMSVWQEWLISLAHIFPVDGEERHVSDLVHQLFSMLLHHAIKLEYGGWRVWVDTLAIVHSKVSFEQFRVVMSQRYSIYRSERADTRMDPGERARLPVSTIEGVRPHDAEVGKVLEDVLDAVERELEGSANKQAGDDGKGESGNRQIFKTEPPRPIYRTPEFKWSHVHLRLLADLLLAIESDVAGWKVDTTRSVLEHVNATDNSIFVVNTVHVISQLVDNLIMAVGGLLPLLAAATSPNSELEITDGTSQGLSVGIATALLVRFVNLVDVFVFASSVGFSELEHEKNMPAGGILRQCLRLVSTIAVRNNLLCRYHRVADPATIAHDLSIDESIQQLISDPTGVQGTPIDVVLQAVSIQDFDFLLQEIDLNRLKAVIYRDMEETKQAQFLSLAVVYFVSVLMVSRYRDILEPPLSPSPFFDSSPSPQSRATPPGETPTKEENEQPAIENSVAEEKVEEDEAATIDTTEDRPKRATEQTEAEKPAEATTPGEVRPSAIAEAEGEEEGEIRSEDGEEEEKEVQPISAISGTSDAVAPSIDDGRTEQYKPADLHIAAAPQNVSRERQAQLTDKLCKALNNTAPLLREIMSDFHSFLQRTLLGTHGQEIMNDNRVIHTLRNQGGSVIELVMLLCSQEWQTSLQKHAGLAFIELVNEGRLLAHATRDHIVRVANEADFILNRLRAEDVSKHAEFETVCAQATLNRKQEESTCDHLIVSARRRDAILAMRLNDKILNVLCSEHGAWYDDDELMQTFWRLDVWEDDSRRRKRLVPNPYGSAHPNAALKGDGNPTEQEKAEADAAREDVLAELVCRRGMIVPPSRLAGHTADELIDEAELARLGEEDQDNGESVANFSTPAKLICPGAMVAGTLAITSNELYFDVAEDSDELQQQDAKVLRYCENLHGRWHFGEIRAIFLRRYLLQNTALELFLASRTAIMFAFSNHATVKRVVQHLPSVGVGVKYGLPQSRRASLMSPRQLYKHSDMSQRWQRREISNFDYLMFLNTIAGRTYNDLNQYPVFPWILSNYECDELDLNQPSNFRDLSKPIGAINPSRRAYFEERYSSWEHEHIPAFHYGTHYSTAAFVLNWMVRVEPFTTMFLNLQGGKFDVADRTFSSVSHAWRSCQRDTHDVKELIPEFFYLPEMLLNSNNYQFGAQDDGLMVNHVTLPAWAKNPEHFIAVHRAALESDLVSCQLHQWIDLIFGYKQRGPEAVRATNVFYYLTYEGSVDLSTLDDPIMKEALEGQIRNFGQTPSQLLSEPHPPRQSILTISPMVFAPVADDLCMVLKFISNSPIVHISANTHPSVASPTVISVTASLCFALNRWNNNYTGATNVPTLPNTPTASTAPTTIGEGGDAAQTQTVMPNLPLAVDPLLATGSPATPAARRNLGEAFDQRLRLSATNFVTTVDSRYIIAAGYADYSFRVISTENARVVQVVYGHKSVVTCVARSECNVVSDCYIATGSWDCTVLLWHWNAKVACVAGEYNAPGEVPSPRAVLTGHDDAITALVVSAEHGLVISGSSDGSVLVHTTSGDLLRCLTAPSPAHAPSALAMTRDCLVVVVYDHKHLCLYSAASGRLLTQRTGQTNSHVDTICLSRDGDYILCGGDEGVLNVFRLFNFEQLYSMPACDSSIKSVALTQNHSTVHYSCLIRASFRFALCGLSSGAIVVFNVDFNKWHPEYQQRYTAGR